MKILDYTILGSNSDDQLSGQVAAYLAKGWQPFGSLQVVCPVLDEVPAPAFYQTVVLYAPAAPAAAATPGNDASPPSSL